MASSKLVEVFNMKEELIKKSMEAHKFPKKSYLIDKSRTSSDTIIISFPGLWSVNDLFTGDSFGEKKIDLPKFPSLRNVGNDGENEIAAVVNEAFLNRFEPMLPLLEKEVGKAVIEGKQIVFTGHSLGGPIAILATVWFLERKTKPEPLCVTFGSPLVGDHIFNHALRRENWSQYFTHFVMRYDILPRVSFSPVYSIKKELEKLLQFWKRRCAATQDPFEEVCKLLYQKVTTNASSVANKAACHLKRNTNKLIETVSSFIKLSPYRPSGNYVFCTGKGKLVVVTNPDVVLQILFYSSQLSSESECATIAKLSVTSHVDYEREFKNLGRLTVTHLDKIEELPLSSDGSDTDTALNDLGLSMEARLCLVAARELGKQKLRNQEEINAKQTEIINLLRELEVYKTRCEAQKLSYYDAFKLSECEDDFHANVNRLKLAGIWDEPMEMLKRSELPDGFERCKVWIDLGTRYRRLVEPLDIANYYRHSKNHDTGTYMEKGRPKRYRFTQRWYEYDQGGLESHESCFWAEVEELCFETSKPKMKFEDVRGRVLELESQVKEWIGCGELGDDIFFKESTFVKWWKTLPESHGSGSCIAELMSN